MFHKFFFVTFLSLSLHPTEIKWKYWQEQWDNQVKMYALRATSNWIQFFLFTQKCNNIQPPLNVQLKRNRSLSERRERERKRTAIRAIWKLYQALCSGSGCYSFIYMCLCLFLFFLVHIIICTLLPFRLARTRETIAVDDDVWMQFFFYCNSTRHSNAIIIRVICFSCLFSLPFSSLSLSTTFHCIHTFGAPTIFALFLWWCWQKKTISLKFL